MYVLPRAPRALALSLRYIKIACRLSRDPRAAAARMAQDFFRTPDRSVSEHARAGLKNCSNNSLPGRTRSARARPSFYNGPPDTCMRHGGPAACCLAARGATHRIGIASGVALPSHAPRRPPLRTGRATRLLPAQPAQIDHSTVRIGVVGRAVACCVRVLAG